MILSQNLCIYALYAVVVSICTLRHGVNMNFASDKASLQNINKLKVKNFTLKVLSEIVFIFFFVSLYCIQISQYPR